MGAQRLCSVLVLGFFGSSLGHRQGRGQDVEELLSGFQSKQNFINCNWPVYKNEPICFIFNLKTARDKCRRKTSSERMQSISSEYEGMADTFKDHLEDMDEEMDKLEVIPSLSESDLESECVGITKVSEAMGKDIAANPDDEKAALAASAIKTRADKVISMLGCASDPAPTGNSCCFGLPPRDNNLNGRIDKVTKAAENVTACVSNPVSSSLLACPECALVLEDLAKLKALWGDVKKRWTHLLSEFKAFKREVCQR